MATNTAATKTRIKALHSIPKPEHHEEVVDALQVSRGNWDAAAVVLKDKLSPGLLRRLDIADSITTAVGNEPVVIKAIVSPSPLCSESLPNAKFQ